MSTLMPTVGLSGQVCAPLRWSRQVCGLNAMGTQKPLTLVIVLVCNLGRMTFGVRIRVDHLSSHVLLDKGYTYTLCTDHFDTCRPYLLLDRSAFCLKVEEVLRSVIAALNEHHLGPMLGPITVFIAKHGNILTL